MSRIYEALTEKNNDEKSNRVALTIYGDDDANDGFAYGAAAARERELRGRLVTYADRVWNTKEGEIPEGTRLAALGMGAFWVEWKDGKPVKYIRPEPGRLLPGRESLGRLDESEWSLGRMESRATHIRIPGLSTWSMKTARRRLRSRPAAREDAAPWTTSVIRSYGSGASTPAPCRSSSSAARRCRPNTAASGSLSSKSSTGVSPPTPKQS
jgi:hypothetical protein